MEVKRYRVMGMKQRGEERKGVGMKDGEGEERRKQRFCKGGTEACDMGKSVGEEKRPEEGGWGGRQKERMRRKKVKTEKNGMTGRSVQMRRKLKKTTRRK